MQKIRKRKPINWFLVGLLTLPVIVIGAYFWATNTISSLENYRSPLYDSAPEPGDTIGIPITRRVVVVLFDALRYDTSMDKAVMPFLNNLRAQGASAIMTSRPPSFSAPAWTTILTGAWPDINDGQPMNPPDIDSTRTFTQDNIFAAVDRINLRSAVSGYIWFENMLADSGLDAGFFTSGEDKNADQDVVMNALPWLVEDYQLVLIHIDQIDYAGHHEGGPIDPAWNAAASRADLLLTDITSQLDLELDTLILLSDHGQISRGGHGGNDEVTMIEPFIAIGKSIIPGTYNDIDMVDVASTIAVLLGTNIPASNQGEPLLEMLDIPTSTQSVVKEVLSKQQLNLFSAYTQAIGQEVKFVEGEDVVLLTQQAMENARLGRLARERIWRNLIAVFLCFMPGYILYLRKEKKVLWWMIGTLVYLLIFNLRYLVLDKNPFSLSWIPGISDFIIYVAITTGISLVPAWLVTVIGLKTFKKSPREASGDALGFIWFTIYILSIPFLINLAINGIQTTWTLPVFSPQYIGFFAAVQSLFVSGLGLVLIGFSALVVKFYKKLVPNQ